jgi:exodeoxyribonuclease-3
MGCVPPLDPQRLRRQLSTIDDPGKMAAMRVATYNAASVRARLPIILEWLAEFEPDVLAIQETKVEDSKFPVADFEDLGYQVALNGQKAWNGVALLSRNPICEVRPGFGDELWANDARVLSGEIDGVAIVNTYVPNGSEVGSDKFAYKLKWLERFAQYLRQRFSPQQPLIWLGDINIAPTPADVYDSKRFYGGVGHHPDEFSRLARILEFGLEDVYRRLHPEPGAYTFWDFVIPRSVERNLGWRIDHIYATAPMAARLRACEIDVAARSAPKPSDHTFLYADFE